MESMFHMLLYRVFHAQRSYLRPYVKELGLGSGQPKLLAYLEAHGSCQQRDLAEYFEIDRAAVSRMLDTLEKGGFLTRRIDQKNRRADLVEISPKGKCACQAWREHCKEMEQVLLQGFRPEEKDAFAEYLLRAYRNLKGRA